LRCTLVCTAGLHADAVYEQVSRQTRGTALVVLCVAVGDEGHTLVFVGDLACLTVCALLRTAGVQECVAEVRVGFAGIVAYVHAFHTFATLARARVLCHTVWHLRHTYVLEQNEACVTFRANAFGTELDAVFDYRLACPRGFVEFLICLAFGAFNVFEFSSGFL